jgi:hypothetical protein
MQTYEICFATQRQFIDASERVASVAVNIDEPVGFRHLFTVNDNITLENIKGLFLAFEPLSIYQDGERVYVYEPPKELKTYILIDHDECRVHMIRAEDEDDLPEIYHQMLCDEEVDHREDPSREWIDRKFKDGEIKVECTTFYEKERQTVTQLFDW